MGNFSLTMVLVAVFALAATAQDQGELTRFLQSLQNVHSLQTYDQKYRDLENRLKDYPSLVQFLPPRPSTLGRSGSLFGQSPSSALTSGQLAALLAPQQQPATNTATFPEQFTGDSDY